MKRNQFRRVRAGIERTATRIAETPAQQSAGAVSKAGTVEAVFNDTATGLYHAYGRVDWTPLDVGDGFRVS